MVTKNGLATDTQGVCRCSWGASHELYYDYHDQEWGVPEGDDHRLFEKICLEGFQSGLSWLTILKKRPAFRSAFADFDFDRIAEMGPDDVERLMGDASIVRNRRKIEATLNNAKRAQVLRHEFGSLAAYFWRFEPPRRSKALDWDTLRTLATSPESTALAKDLKRRGWTFVGPTTAYAFMQAMGLVNDHVAGCHVQARVEALAKAYTRPS